MKYMNKAGDVVKELEYLKNSEKIKVESKKKVVSGTIKNFVFS